MEPFTHLLPLKCACGHFLSLAHSSSNAYTLCQSRTLPTSQTQPTCAFTAHISAQTSDLCGRWNAALMVECHCFPPPRLGGGEGLCLPIGLASTHQPLGSPSGMTFMQKLCPFTSRSWPVPLPEPGMLLAQCLSLPTHSEMPDEHLDTLQDSA